MRIAIGSDHSAIEMKNNIKGYLAACNIDFIDVGTHSTETCDYPDIAKSVCDEIIKGEADKGILICGTGIGVSIAANKMEGIRAAVCSEHYSAKHARLHNDANVLCLGARVIGSGLAAELAGVFINTDFEGGRHIARVEKIMDL